ncbi:MAG: MASE1 domain-containing protein [Rhodospirillaceae bacterium]|nr:MASE1 domain-containing protein [Rhodospirillaceae bacterium]
MFASSAYRMTWTAAITDRPLLSWQLAGVLAAYVAAYVALDWASYIAPVAPFAITPWNPSVALSVVLVYALGAWVAPALAVAAVCADLVVRGMPAPLPLTAINALVMATGYTFAGLVLRRALAGSRAIDTRRGLLWFLAIAAASSLPVAATFVGVLTAPALLPLADYWYNTLMLWVGDVIGIVVFAPILLHLIFRQRRAEVRVPPAEIAGQAASILVALWIVFGLPYTDIFRFFYVFFPPVIWIALRHGVLGAVLASIAVQVGIVIAVEVVNHPPITVLELQMLMLTLAVTGLFLGVVVAERREAIAALRSRDEEMNHILRLGAVSEMASALAHELNQPLAAIANYVRAAHMIATGASKVADPALLPETLTKAVAEVDRAGKVVHRLRDFYRTGAGHIEPVDTETLVRESIAPLSSRFARHGIQLNLDLPRPPLFVLADRVQLAAVIHNIVANAVDALKSISRDGQGLPARTIAITVSADGDRVAFSIGDNGPGLPIEIRDVFEPFVTTKDEGLGLGLTIARSIIEAHDGRIGVGRSRLGGAEFRFTLPAYVQT